MARLTFALALLAGGLAFAQPDTYFAPIVRRTPATSPVGAVGMGTTLWLPDPGVTADQSLLFGTGGGTAVPFVLGTQDAGSVTGFPTHVDALAAAPGVLVAGSSKTLLAVLSNGQVTFGTVESGAYVPKGPLTPISAGTVIALSAVPGGGAALLVSNGSQVARFEIDVSSGMVAVTPGASMSAAPSGANDQANALVFDGMSNQGFVGGGVLGDIYRFDARLDAGLPTVFDLGALSPTGRLAGPVTGLALYDVPERTYLLAANKQGLTIYDLDAGAPASSGFRVIPYDTVGPITAPAGVTVTNLPVGTTFPSGVIAVGDRTQTDLALLSWDQLAFQVDGGLVIDTTFDPRDAGSAGPDGGTDGGFDGGGGGGGGTTPPGGGPMGPGIPVEQPSSCTTAAGAPVLLLLLAALGLLLPRRQRR